MVGSTFPILTFDEGKLSPSQGYIFDPKWLDPYESLVSMLWKFSRMNGLAGHVLVKHAAKRPVDPYEGITATLADIDLRRICTILRLPMKTLRAALPRANSKRAWCSELQYCPQCMARRFHSIVHQLCHLTRCPVHGCPLVTACFRCRSTSAYRIDAKLVGAPFRCPHCGATYSGSTASLAKRPPLSQLGRTAITRAYFGLG